ncbi:MAG: glucosamine-6-phosphate deaminase [Eubacteriales bacterium]|nr:glucosamine-6-phosphate deaminase [Eubacteriales bacterium]
MKIQIYDNYEHMSLAAAKLLEAQIRLKPNAVLGLATGSTPIGLYQELGRLYREENLDFSELTTINLDEYVGLGPDHPGSYRYFMDQQLFSQVNIDYDSTYVPNGLADDPEEEMADYEALCDYLPRDLQVLGIGHDGHIAFCEPDDSFATYCHVAELLDSTIAANKRFFRSKEEVPARALSMGIKQILNAKKILMLVNGEAKTAALKAMVTGPVTPKVPASILQLHPDVLVLCDEAAAKEL